MVPGDVAGWGKLCGQGGGQKVSSCSECAAKCLGCDACGSYECSGTELKCNLNKQSKPTSRYIHRDYAFCVKPEQARVVGRFKLHGGRATGGCPGQSKLGVPKVNSKAECADMCFGNAGCVSFEWGPAGQCQLSASCVRPMNPTSMRWELWLKKGPSVCPLVLEGREGGGSKYGLRWALCRPPSLTRIALALCR